MEPRFPVTNRSGCRPLAPRGRGPSPPARRRGTASPPARAAPGGAPCPQALASPAPAGPRPARPPPPGAPPPAARRTGCRSRTRAPPLPVGRQEAAHRLARRGLDVLPHHQPVLPRRHPRVPQLRASARLGHVQHVHLRRRWTQPQRQLQRPPRVLREVHRHQRPLVRPHRVRHSPPAATRPACRTRRRTMAPRCITSWGRIRCGRPASPAPHPAFGPRSPPPGPPLRRAAPPSPPRALAPGACAARHPPSGSGSAPPGTCRPERPPWHQLEAWRA